MPADSDAAGKAKNENKNNPLDFGNDNNTPGQRMKELVNLDSFKNSITNVCQLWLSGLPAPPRRYEQWRSKIVQQEKISFTDPALTSTSPTDAPTIVSTTTTTAFAAPPNTVTTMHSSLQASLINGSKSAPAESTLTSSHQLSSRRHKRKEPYELLEEIFKHTNDPLPEYEEFVFFVFIKFNPFRRIFTLFRLSKWSTGWIQCFSFLFFFIFACSHPMHVLLAISFNNLRSFEWSFLTLSFLFLIVDVYITKIIFSI